MKITLRTNDKADHNCSLPYEGAAAVDVDDGTTCNHCDEVLRVYSNQHQSCGDGSVKGRALCLSCKKEVGFLFVEFNTIFGLEEDQRVLNGRCRVY